MSIQALEQTPEVRRSLTALGGVFAGFCGGLASMVPRHGTLPSIDGPLEDFPEDDQMP